MLSVVRCHLLSIVICCPLSLVLPHVVHCHLMSVVTCCMFSHILLSHIVCCHLCVVTCCLVTCCPLSPDVCCHLSVVRRCLLSLVVCCYLLFLFLEVGCIANDVCCLVVFTLQFHPWQCQQFAECLVCGIGWCQPPYLPRSSRRTAHPR